MNAAPDMTRDEALARVRGLVRAQPAPYSDARQHPDAAPASGPVVAAGLRRTTAVDVLSAWAAEGPLVHEPTGLATLDALTGGGPVYGSRWYLLGAPDAGKTALLVQIADTYLARGLVVGLLAVDEEASDVLTRMMQRRGFSRSECEQRDPLTLATMRDRLSELARLVIYGPDWTIESAAADLAILATEHGARALLGVDSLQTVKCDAEADADTPRAVVTARTRAIRAVATAHRMIVIATSEMARGAYRSVEAAEATDDMASAKESGAVEYSARVMLAMRSAKDDPDLFELRIAKNKHGPRGDRLGLRLSRQLMTLQECDAPEIPDPAVAREMARRNREQAKTTRAAVALVAVLVERPGMSWRDVTPALRVAMGSCSSPVALAAATALGRALVRVEGPRGKQATYIEGRLLPEAIVAELPGKLRSAALASRQGGHGG
jgi:KaiC/GvpD/RAD55 family RecA-like ATPase